MGAREDAGWGDPRRCRNICKSSDEAVELTAIRQQLLSNPESLDSSIQSVLSALFPPFEVTAPTVLSQLFRLIEERYCGDALQCLLDFLIPSKHLLESVQQAACAGYSDVVFRCEGWPLCLHDKTVIQLAPVNPLLLRPGDFYLQVEPFGDQAVRIVLKSLLEEGCREVEETPILETSYPCMFTEEWLQDLNDGRHGTPLSRCLLCTDQGVVKLPWVKIAIPEFLDKPKIMPTYQELTPVRKHTSAPSHFNSSTLPVEAMFHPAKDRMSASLRPVDCGFRRIPKSRSKPLTKPVGWVSPNNWDSPETCREIEGDYVDLVDLAKGQEVADKQNDERLQMSVFKPVGPAPPVPCRSGIPCACTLQCAEEAGQELTDQDLKCRYRDSYVSALKNPVAFKKGSVDHLSALEEGGLPGGGLPGPDISRAGEDQLERVCNHFNKTLNNELHQNRQSSQTRRENVEEQVESKTLMKEPPVVLNSSPGLRHSEKVTMKLISKQPDPNAGVTLEEFLENNKPHRTAGPPGKQQVKVRSLSTVSETSKGSPLLYKLSSRSHSDVCPDTISSVMQKGELLDQMSQRPERRTSPRKDILPSRSESPSVVNGPVSKLHNSKTERPSPSLHSFETQNSSQSGQPSFRSIGALLELGIICLPGSRDRAGRSVVEVHGDRKEWTSPLVSAQNVCELLLYLHSIPRKEIRELGMTLVINARKKAPPLHLYKALLMAQEQALHAVHSIVTLVDKDTCPRPEKHPGLQTDLVTSMKALNKTVEASQLTSDLGGSFPYIHADWLQFHQRLVSFMADLREADGLLQRAIEKVDDRNKVDTAQEVQQCIEEQRCLMKEVLEDARLVTLQREGGAVLARMRREDFRFPQSEDYRDALESATGLYNQVEEKLHTLVMRSNESLQHLHFLFRLRETEAKISTVGMWLNSEGEQMLKDSDASDSLGGAEKALQRFDLFLVQAKEKQQYAVTLVTEAEEIVGLGCSGPAMDIFGTLVRTLKSDVDDFMLRAEQRRRELETLLHVHSFCDQASALAKECCLFLEKVEQRCYSASTRSTLQMYEERLGGEFSTLNFQAVKAKACAVGSGAGGAMKVWNAAWVQCQQLRQHLHKMREIQQTTAAHPQPEDGGVEKLEEGSEGQQPNSQEEDVSLSEHERGEVATATSPHQCLNPDLTVSLPHATVQRAAFPHNRPREHHSEADLRTVEPAGGGVGFPARQHLGRSLSEGSHAGCQLPSSFLPLNVRNKHCQSRTQPLQLNLHPIHNLPGCHNDSYASGYLGSESDGKDECGEVHADSSEVPRPLTPETPAPSRGNSNNLKLQKIMEELLTTEREYVSALGYVREHYFPELERADVPQDLRGQRGIIFGNLEKLHDFHQHHFLSELEGCVNEPFRVGRCFLRHKESFALYALYSKNKPQSDALFISHGQSFFKQKQLKLGDKMDLWSYLLKPVQRISKYSLLLQDMMADCGPRQSREMAEVKAALEVIHYQLRHGNNLLAMDAIQHCDVNLKEQGQLIRQDEFLVTLRKKKCFRHIFLFQELVLFSKTRKTEVGNDTYIYKQSFKTTDIGLTQNSGDTGLCFEIWFRKRKTQDTYTLQAVNRAAKEAWTRDLERILWEQAVHNREIRMQERVFMGIGNKPFMDIQPSDAAISDRAVNRVLIERGSSRSLEDGLPGGRPKSLGSGSSSSSSSSSGIGSLPPVGYLCGPKRRVASGGIGGYVSPPGALEEDDLDQGGAAHNLLLDSSESSGESVSGFSSSSLSYHSAVGGEAEDAGSVCTSTVTVKEALVVCGAAVSSGSLRMPEEPLPSVPPKPEPQELPCDKAQSTNVGKSTVV